MLNALRFKGEPAFEGALAGALIQRNATGMAVRKLQRSLITLGFPIPAGATGFFGDQTVQAVGDYQTSRGLSRDGQVGHDTMAALDNDFAAELRPFPGWFLSWPATTAPRYGCCWPRTRRPGAVAPLAPTTTGRPSLS